MPFSGSLSNSITRDSDRYVLKVSDAASRINVNACDNLGVLLDDLKRKSEALQAYETALRGDPGLADCHYNLALLYEEFERPREALRHMAEYRRLTGAKSK